jgi:hypothetical protein
LGDEPILQGTKASTWWKDVIGKDRGTEVDWFGSNIGCCIGNGKDVGFWKFKWNGTHPLKDLFPTLFKKETFKDVMVADRLITTESIASWVWNLNGPLSDIE